MIKQINISYYKSITQSGDLALQPFTAFIGNNGSGKSSAIEALRTLHIAVTQDLQAAFEMWGGLDKVRNYHAMQEDTNSSIFNFPQRQRPIRIRLQVELNNKTFDYQVEININPDGDFYVLEKEILECNGEKILSAEIINEKGVLQRLFETQKVGKFLGLTNTGELSLYYRNGNPLNFSDNILAFQSFISNWQFLYLDAHTMGLPVNQNRLVKEPRLDYDGRNIAEYILSMSKKEEGFIDRLIQKMQFVLPYLQDIQTKQKDAFNQTIELLFHEQNGMDKDPGHIPGWLMSSGTLRILAILAIFTQTNKPGVLFIDEIENGLDPRTVGLLVSEIESVFHSKEMQVIVTTHSPYFLDMIRLESVIVTEKTTGGSTYHIPADDEALEIWKEKFSPGKLYSMGNLTK